MNNNNRFKFKNWLNLNIQQQWRKLKTEVVDRCPLFRYDDDDDFKFSLKLNNHISNFDSFSLLFETKQNKTHTHLFIEIMLMMMMKNFIFILMMIGVSWADNPIRQRWNWRFLIFFLFVHLWVTFNVCLCVWVSLMMIRTQYKWKNE